MNPVQNSICTYHGTYFDFLNPQNSAIDIVDIAHALSNICRFAGHTSKFYSVAEHSVHVSYLVPPELALDALMHDAAEAYIGDVSSPLKALLPEYKSIERKIEHVIRRHFRLSLTLDTLVKQADMIMLATERRDLMPDLGDSWECLLGVKPREQPVQALSPAGAYILFLHRYQQLTKV